MSGGDQGDVRVAGRPGDRWVEHDGLRFGCRVRQHPDPAFPPTLFVSGAFQTMESWTRFARAFQPHTTVVLVDPPGMGRSAVLPPEAGLDVLAGCLLRVLDELDVAQITLVAASYGTPAAYRLAQLRPDRVARVVLGGTMRQIPPHLRDRVAATVEMARRGEVDVLVDEIVDGLTCRDPHLPVDRRELAERVLRAGLVRMTPHELAQYAANTTRLLAHPALDLGTPIVGPEALVFTGEHDTFTRPGDAREVARGFARAWFTVLERADHLFHLQRFDATIELLLRFATGRLGEPPQGWAAPTWAGAAPARG